LRRPRANTSGDGVAPTIYVIGRVVRFHVKDELFGENGCIDVAGLNPLARLASDYTKLENIFELPAYEL
jgi:flavin reductase (DIM6/NTAB) family NADH-FMN oxidoreductase RutF